MGTAEKKTIVLVWSEARHVWDGEPYRQDLGAMPNLVLNTTITGVVWLNAGTMADAKKARAHVTKEYPETGRIFLCDTKLENPIAAAVAAYNTNKEGPQ